MNSNNYSLIVSLMRATVCTSSKIALTSKEARHFGEPLIHKNNISGLIFTTTSLQRLKSHVPFNVHGYFIHTPLWVYRSFYLFLYLLLCLK
ncbi:hypothetical protein BFS05_02250 [Gardnerella vaginalis]|uniref:Uncharacterized protein n=1 Tax=Gardnerella vaginalis TaxID=2702 RepID=A0A2K1SV44_GARVA|nr:hypothetical protein BFS05_02250 [Gardnerella vaginalis]